MQDTRARAAGAVRQAADREASATTQAARFLAPDVVLDTTGAHMWGNGTKSSKATMTSST